MGEIKFGKELLGGTTDVLEDGRLIGRMSKVQGQWGFYQGNPPGQLASPRYKADSPEELLALIRQVAVRCSLMSEIQPLGILRHCLSVEVESVICLYLARSILAWWCRRVLQADG